MCAFTTDFDRASAGYSPDSVDALVWALTDLLVESMKNHAFYEVTRQRIDEMRQQNSKAEPPKTVYPKFGSWLRRGGNLWVPVSTVAGAVNPAAGVPAGSVVGRADIFAVTR